MATTVGAHQPEAATSNPILHSPHLAKVTLGLAWPVFVSRLLHTLFQLANIFWVAHIGPSAIAAVTTSMFVLWTVQSLSEMVAIGATSVMARHFGAGRPDEAARTAGQGIFTALVMSVLLTLGGALGAGEIFKRVTTDPAVVSGGTSYLTIAT